MIGWMRHIEYLLLHNDNVAVPGLGCFRVIHHEARLLSDGSSFLPPARSIIFEEGEGRSDDWLVRSWMRARFISREEALSEITGEVANLRRELESKHRCDLGRLGTLVKESGVITFQSSKQNAVEYTRFGLAPLTTTPLGENSVEEEEGAVNIAEGAMWQKNPERIYISFSRRFARVASVAAAVIFFLLMVSRPVDSPDAMSHYAGLLSAELFTPSDQSVEGDSPELWEPLPVVETTVQPLAKADSIQQQQPVEPQSQSAVSAKRGNYYIVVASLPTRSLAEKQIECFRQQGVTDELSVHESPHKARLYVASFDKIGEAQQYLARLVKEQALFANAWIMKDKG